TAGQRTLRLVLLSFSKFCLLTYLLSGPSSIDLVRKKARNPILVRFRHITYHTHTMDNQGIMSIDRTNVARPQCSVFPYAQL
ncbi:MAG: hypothetical protein ACREV1_18455, partial [Gammaproteobacteria bacterium]